MPQSYGPDYSGTPGALIDQMRRSGRVVVLDQIDDADVVVDYPMGHVWQDQTGCSRFVKLRRPRDGRDYALVRS